VIESAGAKTQKAASIKSHHNVGGLPETLHLKLLEPLRELFKDEVRELGLALGLPREMVFRHPFPGPGLGVRILGEVKKEYADLLRRADDIFLQELRAAGWYDKTAQAFAVFLPVKSVGVMGDGRTYEYVVALRAVQTTDFMTADWRNCRTNCWRRSPAASSTRCAASTAWPTTSPPSRPPPSSGSDRQRLPGGVLDLVSGFLHRLVDGFAGSLCRTFLFAGRQASHG